MIRMTQILALQRLDVANGPDTAKSCISLWVSGWSYDL